jgi:hypothetical protein
MQISVNASCAKWRGADLTAAIMLQARSRNGKIRCKAIKEDLQKAKLLESSFPEMTSESSSAQAFDERLKSK